MTQTLDDPHPSHGATSPRPRAIVAAHLLLIRSYELLLARRQNTGYADGLLHLPSGHAEPGESIVDTLIREAREELDITIRPDALRFAHVMHRRSDDNRIDFFFAVETWAGVVKNQEPHKCSELRWVPITDLPDDTVPYAGAAIEHYLHDDPFSLHGWPESV